MGKKWLANIGLILLVVFGIFLVGYYAGSSPTGLAIGICGNGIVEAREQCDDGNRVNGDGCNRYCRSETAAAGRRSSSVCGNGILETTESCDDGNRVNSDGCSAVCFVEVPASVRRSCGNGAVDSGEMCDEGGICTSDNITPCTSDSQCPRFRGFSGRCAPRNGDGCDLNCMVEGRSICGNEVLEEGEECDDGNRIDGDGCDFSCQFELPENEVICDGLDDNSNGQVDEGCDDDGDDYCDSGMNTAGTPAVCPNGGGDCHDNSASINPGSTENCFTSGDDNCNRQYDEGCTPYTCSDNDEANDPLMGGTLIITSANGQVSDSPFLSDSCYGGQINQTLCRSLSSPYPTSFTLIGSVSADCPSGTTCSDPDGISGTQPAVCS